MNGPTNTRRGPAVDYERASSPDKRLHERLPLTALVTISTGNRQISGLTADVGFGGCFVNTAAVLSEGQLVDVSLRHENKILRGQAVVVRTVRNEGLALEFTSIPSDQDQSLMEWLSDFHRHSQEHGKSIA